MYNITNLKHTNIFFNKNIFYLCVYPIIYIIEYLAVLFSAFITWHIQFTCDDGHICSINNQIYFDYIDILHTLTVIAIIYHIYNELQRELFLIKYASLYVPYNTDKFVLSYMILFFIYSTNIIMSYILLIKHNQYNLYTSLNIIFHTIVIIPVLFKSYSVLIDKNYTKSVIFYDNIYYVRSINIINYNDKLEHFKNNTLYPKDIFI
jgi:hypothetical protein